MIKLSITINEKVFGVLGGLSETADGQPIYLRQNFYVYIFTQFLQYLLLTLLLYNHHHHLPPPSPTQNKKKKRTRKREKDKKREG